MVARNDDTIYITEEHIAEVEKEMLSAAEELDFEKAAMLRDRIGKLREAIGEPLSAVAETKSGYGKKGRRGRKRRSGSKKYRDQRKRSDLVHPDCGDSGSSLCDWTWFTGTFPG